MDETTDIPSLNMVDDILVIVNGRFWRGAGALIRDFFQNKRNCKAFMKEMAEEPIQ